MSNKMMVELMMTLMLAMSTISSIKSMNTTKMCWNLIIMSTWMSLSIWMMSSSSWMAMIMLTMYSSGILMVLSIMSSLNLGKKLKVTNLMVYQLMIITAMTMTMSANKNAEKETQLNCLKEMASNLNVMMISATMTMMYFSMMCYMNMKEMTSMRFTK